MVRNDDDVKLIKALRIIYEDLRQNKISSKEQLRKVQAVCAHIFHEHQIRKRSLSEQDFKMIVDFLDYKLQK